MKIFKKKESIGEKVNKEMRIHYQELFETSISELHFANLQIEHLYSVLDELITFTGTLEKAVIENAINRHELDKLIHAKLLFGNNPEGFKKDEKETK